MVDRVVDLTLALAMGAIVSMVGDSEYNVDGVEVRDVADEERWNWDRNGNMATGNGNESKLTLSCSFCLIHLTFQLFRESSQLRVVFL